MAKIIHRRTVIAAGIAGGVLAAPRHGWAKGSYPTNKTRRIVVPFAAGGTADCLGRVVAQILTESMSSTFVVENWTGAGGTGHLAMEYLQGQAGIRLKHVAYDSRSLMIKDLLAGRILITMDNLPPYLRHIQSGVLQALGVSSARQWFAAPDVPSIAEQGYPDFEAALWWYIAAPAGTRLELVKKLSDEIVKGIKSETAIRKIRESGASERPGNTEDLAKHITAERIKWKKVIEAAKLEPQ